jgi:hypothetical protein
MANIDANTDTGHHEPQIKSGKNDKLPDADEDRHGGFKASKYFKPAIAIALLAVAGVAAYLVWMRATWSLRGFHGGGLTAAAAWNLDFLGLYRRQTEADRANLLATDCVPQSEGEPHGTGERDSRGARDAKARAATLRQWPNGIYRSSYK